LVGGLASISVSLLSCRVFFCCCAKLTLFVVAVDVSCVGLQTEKAPNPFFLAIAKSEATVVLEYLHHLVWFFIPVFVIQTVCA